MLLLWLVHAVDGSTEHNRDWKGVILFFGSYGPMEVCKSCFGMRGRCQQCADFPAAEPSHVVDFQGRQFDMGLILAISLAVILFSCTARLCTLVVRLSGSNG